MDLLKRTPLYKQFEQIIVSKIKNRELQPGMKLPSERRLANKYKVNRQTIRRAIQELRKKGIIKVLPSNGTYVKEVQPVLGLSFPEHATGISELLQTKGIKVQSLVKKKAIITNDQYLNSKLDLNRTQTVFALKRLRLIKDSIFALEYNFLPLNLFPAIENIDFEKVNLYDYMASQNKMPVNVDQTIEVLPALANIAKSLQIPEKTLVYKIQYISLDKQHRIVEFTNSYILPQKTSIKFYIDYKNRL